MAGKILALFQPSEFLWSIRSTAKEGECARREKDVMEKNEHAHSERTHDGHTSRAHRASSEMSRSRFNSIT